MLKKIKNLKQAFVVSTLALFLTTGICLAAEQIINNYYGEATINQGMLDENSATMGSVAAVNGICNGSEPTTQMCNVNVYELESQTALTAADGVFSDDLNVSGDTVVEEFTQGGGILASSTITSSIGTLTEAQMLTYNYFVLTLNVSSASVTLPASSTMTTLLPDAGDMREWMISNATTTAATTLTITKGTGIDLIAVTNADDVIDGAEWSRLTCIRQGNTDVLCVVSELVHAD